MEYRREIDGLRAIAVIPVILFHAEFEKFRGGFVGVDIFFVISGYLITTIIINEIEAGKFSLVNFYERRARRILPALFFVMLICAPFAWLWLLPNDMKDFAQSVVAVAVFSSNILFWHESGYFDTAAEIKPLLHTWSLAVEEQFYVLFPLFLMLTWRFGKRWVIGMLAAIGVASLAVANWGSTASPAATFFLLPTRGWELLIGAFTAFYLSKSNRVKFGRTISEFCGWLGLALIFYAIFSFSKTTPFPSIYTLVPTVGAALIILFATQKTSIGLFIGNKAFVGIGLISYSAYLWHQPLFAFARQRSLFSPDSALFVILSLASLVLAYFSWRFIEMPARKQNWLSRKAVFIGATLCSSTLIAAGSAVHLLEGKVGYLHDEKYTALAERLRGNYGLDKDCEEKFTDSLKCKTSEQPDILLWGDSYAMHLARGFIASNGNIKIKQATVSQCAPIIGIAPSTAIFGAQNCINGNDRIYEMLSHSQSIKYVVLSSPSFLIGHKSFATRDGIRELTSPEVERHLVNTLEKIKALGKIPIIFSPPPRNGEDIGYCLLKTQMIGISKDTCNFKLLESEDAQKEIKILLSRLNDKHHVVWLEDGICENGVCKASFDEVLIYRDSGHLSYEGSAYIGKKMDFYELVKQTDNFYKDAR